MGEYSSWRQAGLEKKHGEKGRKQNIVCVQRKGEQEHFQMRESGRWRFPQTLRNGRGFEKQGWRLEVSEGEKHW